MPGVARSSLIAGSMLGLSLALPAIAQAHASYVSSNPADPCGPLAVPRLSAGDPRCRTGLVLDQAPGAVTITFSEPVQVVGRGIRVLGPSGRAAQQGKAEVVGDQVRVAVDAEETGTYVVDWQVVSDDTHPARGRFAFSVGQPSARPGDLGGDVGQVTALGLALQALGRWAHFAGFALGFGTIGVALTIRRFAPHVSLPLHTMWRLGTAGIVLLVGAEVPALLGQTASLGLDQIVDGDALADALASPFGRLLAFRLAAALLLWVVAGSLYQEPEPPLATGGAEAEWESPATGHIHAHKLAVEDAAAARAMALASGQHHIHAHELAVEDAYTAAAARPAIGQPLAMSAAIGLGVTLAVIDGLGQHAASFRPGWLGLAVHALHLLSMALWLGAIAVSLTVPRTSKAAFKVAAVSLAGIASSGLAMAVVHIPTPAALLDTTYGNVLLGKQPLLVAAVAIAWLARRLGRSGRLAELGALTVVIGLAGLLVSLPPAR